MPEWLVLVGGVTTGILGIGAAVRMIASTFTAAVRSSMAPVLSELKPNGGNSLRDRVDRLHAEADDRFRDGEERMTRIESKVDALILNLIRGGEGK